MKHFIRAFALCAGLLLAGCAPADTRTEPLPTPTAVTESTQPPAGSMDIIIARMEGAALTNEELQLWYWAEVNAYRQENRSPAPDFSLPLEDQSCPLRDSPTTWQHYFLECALNRWHTAQALIRHSQETPLPTEEAYKGDREILADYMTGMPATELLYGYNEYYRPNTLHQRWLDSLEETYPESVADMARSLNYGYMYFTTLSYCQEPSEDVPPDPSGSLVSFRHILLLPQEEETMGDCIGRAAKLLDEWMDEKNPGESTFAQLASQNSRDSGSAPHGGLYENLRREQLPEMMAQWCFDDARTEGDTAVLPADYGAHILYFRNRQSPAALRSSRDAVTLAQTDLLAQIREAYPVRVDYRDIWLMEDTGIPSLSELLYPDIGHERFPEVPLYLQQNYPGTMYGEYKITTNGCGITSLAMLASYMTDDELTPPELCALYGRYSRPTGTSGALFDEAPPQLGFYLIEKTYDWREARDYMQEGHPVIVCQYRGYWTRGGHYLVLEKLTEDGMVQVRDSNLFNYRKLVRHKEDKFPWDTINGAGQGYWIYDKKATTTLACTRCGNPDKVKIPIVTDYLCSTCEEALIRRSTYLN